MIEGTCEVGMCVLRRLDHDDRFEVLQADALIEASVEVLAEAASGGGPTDYSDGVLTIHGIDGDVVYRVADNQSGRTGLGDATRMMERVS